MIEETIEHDVIVIGAGGAGLRAAIEASVQGDLFVLIALSFFHCSHRIYQPLFHFAHRIYNSLPDLALQIIRKPVAVLVYGGALTGAVATAWILLG